MQESHVVTCFVENSGRMDKADGAPGWNLALIRIDQQLFNYHYYSIIFL